MSKPRSRQRSRTPRPGQRRGVVMLVVLSLLVLFVIISLTFVVVATQFKYAAYADARREVFEDDPKADFDRIIASMLRGQSVRSPLWGHELLRDLYGEDFVLGTLINFDPAEPGYPTGGPVPYRFSAASASPQGVEGDLVRLRVQVNPAENFGPAPSAPMRGFYTSRVFSFLGGPAKGFSGRIVGDEVISANEIVVVLDVMKGEGDLLQGRNQVWGGPDDRLPQAGDRVLINGAEFNGTGFGFEGDNINQLDPTDSVTAFNPNYRTPGWYVALLPNFSAYSNGVVLSPGIPGTHNLAQGGSDEPYDVADYHDMLLSHQPPGATSTQDIIPSLHRPELARYWFRWLIDNVFNPNSVDPAFHESLFVAPYGPDFDRSTLDAIQSGNLGALGGTVDWPVVDVSVVPPTPSTIPLPAAAVLDKIVELKRKFTMRPLLEDHPAFAAANPNIAAWAPSGGPGLYSPATRMLLQFGLDGEYDVDTNGDRIKDAIWIDSRLPVRTTPDGMKYKTLVAIRVQDLDGLVNINFAGNLAQIDMIAGNLFTGPFADTAVAATAIEGLSQHPLLRGSGYGPAEIFFGAQGGFGRLFQDAEVTGILSTRYGSDGFPGFGPTNVLSYLRDPTFPYHYGGLLSGYASPPDPYGRKGVAQALNGQPMTIESVAGFPYARVPGVDAINDPYEMHADARPGADQPFTYAEWERVVRPYDIDAPGLPRRLANTIPVAASNRVTRESISVDSRHIPVAHAMAPRERRQATPLSGQVLSGGTTLLEIYVRRLQAGGVVDPNILYAQVNLIVPPEVLKGQPMDVNRLLGNGQDDSGNLVVDDPMESYLPFVNAWPPNPLAPVLPAAFATSPFNHVNDYVNVPPLDQKQQYMRQLYCLVLLLTDAYNPATGLLEFPNVEGMIGNAQHVESATRVAQWVANVVDFRDPDAIMTGFEFDINPWDGWEVDGDLITVEPTPQRGVVWGAEGVHLMLTEAAAVHDRRVRDTTFDSSGQLREDGDPTLDQFRRPQGSLYLELFNPSGNAPTILGGGNVANAQYNTLPAELYDPLTGRLDLKRLSPPRAGFNFPVWRVAISQHHGIAGGADPTLSPQLKALANPDTASFSVPFTNRFDSAVDPLPIDRLIWFASQDPAGSGPLENATYWNTFPDWDVSLAPGQYAVVGPRPTTVMGSINDPDPTIAWGGDSNQRIVLQPIVDRSNPFLTGVEVYDFNNNQLVPVDGTIQPPVGVVTQMVDPNAQNLLLNQFVGLNITEPLPGTLAYYLEPNPTGDGRIPADAYTDPDDPTVEFVPEHPFERDDRNATVPAPVDLPPLAEFDMLDTRTHQNVRSAYLQRLANPLLAYNPEFGDPLHDPALPLNPYVTVDWATIDCTVYSGEEDTNREVTVMGVPEPIDIYDEDITAPLPRDLEFGSRQRGTFTAAPRSMNSIWAPRSIPPEATPVGAIDPLLPPYLDRQLFNTLGYLNALDPPPQTPHIPPPAISRYQLNPGLPLQMQGAPTQTVYPWLTWHNRPFASPAELMLVPTSAPSRLLYESADWMTGAVRAGGDVFDPAAAILSFRSPFPFLFNFFQGTEYPLGGGPPVRGPNLFRLFDYVETPSLFIGAQRWLDPIFAENNVTLHRPPFNRVSQFRDPGRVNINTVPGDLVWNAVMGDYAPISNWAELEASRRGYALNKNDIFAPTMPTQFANPFRHASAADMMPDVIAAGTVLRLPREVDATLLRRQPDASGVPTGPQPMFAVTAGQPHADPTRSAYFNYQAIMRTPNLVTTNSNVYAVWMTVGYFEAIPAPQVSVAHPDGYMIGQELHADSGKITRRRAFSIIDRSIPVAFQPGQDHNVEKTIRVQRYIE